MLSEVPIWETGRIRALLTDAQKLKQGDDLGIKRMRSVLDAERAGQ